MKGFFIFTLLVVGAITIGQGLAFAEKSYYVYIDELPNWASFANNVMYEATEFWKKANPGLEFYISESPERADFMVQWVKEFGGEHVGFALDKKFIEVGLGDSDCRGSWQPYSSNYVTQIMQHEIGHILGLEHNDNPESIMYPIAANRQYGIIEEKITLGPGYAQFIPLCSDKKISNYDFQITTSDPVYGFDFYMVPSINEYYNFINRENFLHYSNSNCWGNDYLKFAGNCDGIGEEAGILLVINGKQTSAITTLSIKQQERSYTTGIPAETIMKDSNNNCFLFWCWN